MNEALTLTLHRVPLNSGGYAYGGNQYFGVGMPLYYWQFECNGIQNSGHCRAWSRAKALEQVQKQYPFLALKIR